MGEPPAPALELMRVTEEAMWRGIAAASLGGRVGDISHGVESYVRCRLGLRDRRGLHRPRHRLGHAPAAERPQRRPPRRGPKLVEGLALAVEPMITLGDLDTVVLDDDWTVITGDGSWAAHFEHTFTLTPRGAWVLTALDGGEAALTALGVPFGGA